MKTEFEKMADLKQKRIAHFQDAKERSMAIMSSGRDATMIVCELLHNKQIPITSRDLTIKDEDIEKAIKKWRKFFFYEIYGTDPDEEIKQQLKETLPPKTILGF